METINSQNILPMDTIEYVLKSDVTTFYSDMLSNQQGFYTNLITALAILFGLIMLFTIWWHMRGVKLFIREEVSSAFKEKEDAISVFTQRQKQIIDKNIEIYNNKFEELNQNLENRLAIALANVKAEDKKYADEITKQYATTIEEFKKSITQDLISHEAELARVFAIICGDNGDSLIAANWWLHALEAYNEVGDQYMSGVSIDNFLISLDRINYTKINRNTFIDIESTKQRISNSIPDNRERDRMKALEIFDKIQKKMYSE